jgi:hypothetical protein
VSNSRPCRGDGFKKSYLDQFGQKVRRRPGKAIPKSPPSAERVSGNEEPATRRLLGEVVAIVVSGISMVNSGMAALATKITVINRARVSALGQTPTLLLGAARPLQPSADVPSRTSGAVMGQQAKMRGECIGVKGERSLLHPTIFVVAPARTASRKCNDGEHVFKKVPRCSSERMTAAFVFLR